MRPLGSNVVTSMRILFFNEGNLGTYVLGHGQLDAALHAGLKQHPHVEAQFVDLGALGRWGNALATRPIPPLTSVDLDLQSLRWHLVQSARARTRLGRALEQWPADVVHLHSQSVALLIGPTRKLPPIVLSVDATIGDWAAMPASEPSRRRALTDLALSRALERRALRHARLVLAWTSWARRAVQRDAPGAQVIEHHPGLDLGRYRPAARTDRERPRVLFVGGRFAEKGGEDLLAALGDSLGKDIELDIVTPAPEVHARPGVRVHRLGPGDPRLLELQQQADVLCLPTHADATPWALLEAMACATPVISTPVGAIPELLDDGGAGMLVPCSDRRALRQALHALLEDPGQRAQLGARARLRCERHYDAARQFAALLDHLQKLVAAT
jgi:glycosyltransferase involved in cell wall biosynthesis